MGIINSDDAQIVFSDTPGVLKPNYKLQEEMLAFSVSALQDADVLPYATDVADQEQLFRRSYTRIAASKFMTYNAP